MFAFALKNSLLVFLIVLILHFILKQIGNQHEQTYTHQHNKLEIDHEPSKELQTLLAEPQKHENTNPKKDELYEFVFGEDEKDRKPPLQGSLSAFDGMYTEFAKL